MPKALVCVALSAFLGATCGIASPGQTHKPQPAQAEALKALNESESSLADLENIHGKTVELSEKMFGIYSALNKKVTEVARLAGQSGTSLSQLAQATKEMQEMSQSFNLQYLMLQQQMQSENQQFTTISNVLKTKHDTARNSISNIR